MKAYVWASVACLSLTACIPNSLGPGDGGGTPLVITNLEIPNMNIAGTYTLTLTAARYCTDIPPRLQERKYTATITQEAIATADDVTTVTLSGADFWEHPNRGLLNEFTGTVSGTTLRFNFKTGSWGIVEQVGPTKFLEIIGQTEPGFGNPNKTLIFHNFNGEWRIGEDLRDDARHSRCATDEEMPSNHTFRFERQ